MIYRAIFFDDPHAYTSVKLIAACQSVNKIPSKTIDIIFERPSTSAVKDRLWRKIKLSKK